MEKSIGFAYCKHRQFEELRQRLLQRKRHIEIEPCVKLRVLRLFRVGYVVQTR